MKLKEWGFDKNLSTEGLQAIIAKKDKRSREDGRMGKI
jgi:hypothetical protein